MIIATVISHCFRQPDKATYFHPLFSSSTLGVSGVRNANKVGFVYTLSFVPASPTPIWQGLYSPFTCSPFWGPREGNNYAAIVLPLHFVYVENAMVLSTLLPPQYGHLELLRPAFLPYLGTPRRYRLCSKFQSSPCWTPCRPQWVFRHIHSIPFWATKERRVWRVASGISLHCTGPEKTGVM